MTQPFQSVISISAASMISFAAIANDLPDPAASDQRSTIPQIARVPGGLTWFELNSRNSDLAINARIREEIHGMKNLSMKARNVKIITTGGRVILKGVVNTAGEKCLIGNIAIRVQRRENVNNQLVVSRSPSAPTGLRVVQ